MHRATCHWFWGMIVASVLAAGCSIPEAPDCRANTHQCMPAAESSGEVLKICGPESGPWLYVIPCDELGCNAEKTACETAPSCTENYCVPVESYNLSVAFECMEGVLLPKICVGACNTETRGCYDDYRNACENGTTFCVKNGNGTSMEFSCTELGAWNSKFCAAGCDSNGVKCKVTCDQAADGTPCDNADNAISSECRSGTCVPTACVNTYTLDSEGLRCIPKAGCSSNGKINCCPESNRMQVVVDNADTCSFECREEYLSCNGNDQNCEISKYESHLVDCGVCEDGYGDCNESMDGCETKLELLHLTACNSCVSGWENCDSDWTNGCETNLETAHKKSCDACMDGYTPFDNSCVQQNCTPGDKQCYTDDQNVSFVQECNGSGWVRIETCTGIVSCDGNQCGECVNGATRCQNEEMQLKTQTCNNGKWGTAKSCDTQLTIPSNATVTCSNGNCGWTCKSGYHKNGNACEANSDTNCGVTNTNCNNFLASNAICNTTKGECEITGCKTGYAYMTSMFNGSTRKHCVKKGCESYQSLQCSSLDGTYGYSLSFDSHIYCPTSGDCSSVVQYPTLDGGPCCYKY